MRRIIIKNAIVYCTWIGACVVFFSCKAPTHSPKSFNNTDSITIQLGRYLFYDRRLSVNNTKSCGTCHNPDLAFTDGYKRSLGAYADLHQRNTQPLFNLAYLKYLTAADSTIHTAIQQMNNPLFNTHPVEMGVQGNETLILNKIKSDALYQQLFKQAFSNDQTAFDWINIKKAISLFMYQIVSNQSAYDRYKSGDSTALSADQKIGMQLFFSPRLNCGSCHGGFNFSTPTATSTNNNPMHFYNIGLYNVGDKAAYPEYDQGLFAITHQPKDKGKFRVPTLRNLVFTAPYFHDGSAETLAEVIDVFEKGGRNITYGEFAGNGIANPHKDSLIKGFSLTAIERRRLLLFLESLTDSAMVLNANYRNPFTFDETKTGTTMQPKGK
ncbi:MAG: MbnH family di-heme enzyme [Ferruginibacter sp.]